MAVAVRSAPILSPAVLLPSPGTAKAEAPSLTPSQEFEAQLDQIPPLLCSAFYFLCPIDPLDDWSELLSTVLLLE